MEPSEVARRFVEAINAHDLDAVCALMTEDHRFIDSLGEAFVGRDVMRAGWMHYFGMVPDYTICVEESFQTGPAVALFGSTSGTYSPDGSLRAENRWSTPAAWRAIVVGGHLAEWQVYADNEPIRRRMASWAAEETRTSA